ncbi:MAG: glycosyltransferase, partial [Actinobacteria bacterium]|nr:glycosyltransferase [Actinomycetota bacterium]
MRTCDPRRLPRGGGAMKPVLLVTNHVPPDRIPSLHALHEAEGIEVAIYDGRLHHATPGVADPGVPFRRMAQRAVHAATASGSHRAVIATSAGRIALPAAFTGARRARVPFLYWTGIWAPVRTPAHIAATPLLRAIERGADATLAYGPHVATYARSHGARNVHVVPQAVDTDFWSQPGDPVAARARLGLGPAGFLVVYAGRPTPGKGVEVLLEAWRALPPTSGDALALAGVGTSDVGALPSGAIAAGVLAREALRDLYCAADLVVIPSVATRAFREPWGLVANEAMLQGAPVLATDAVGAAAGGLVRDGHTGIVVPAGDAASLTT